MDKIGQNVSSGNIDETNMLLTRYSEADSWYVTGNATQSPGMAFWKPPFRHHSIYGLCRPPGIRP
jgi:hypothetical protein